MAYSKKKSLTRKLESSTVKILLIGENPDRAGQIEQLLSKADIADFEIDFIDMHLKEKDLMDKRIADVILFDLAISDNPDLKFLVRLINNSSDLPVVVLSDLEDDILAVQAIQEGAQDCLLKNQINSRYLALSVLNSIERKRKEKKTTRDFKQTVEKLKKANKKILEQQKSVVEEERLKVLLQMAGATAHELNQPLMALLGFIELMEIDKNNPDKLPQRLARIQEAGQRISEIVNKIQTIRGDDIKSYVAESTFVNLDQETAILSVENSDIDFKVISGILKDLKLVNLTRVMDIQDAMDLLERNRFDLVLLEYILPDGNGMDFLRLMLQKGFETSVVVITGHGDEMIASQMIQAGAYDYLTKDKISNKSLSRIITNTLEKARLKLDMKKVQEKLAEMSTRNELTGLYNRRYFMETLQREVANAGRYGHKLSLCIIDLDHFKKINDKYGHIAGDMVLKEFAGMLRKNVRQSDITCRYGGEEFTVIFPNTGVKDALYMCERFRKMIAGHQFEYNSSSFHVKVSMGVASYSSSLDKSPLDLVDRADKALYSAKQEGRNRIKEAKSL